MIPSLRRLLLAVPAAAVTLTVGCSDGRGSADTLLAPEMGPSFSETGTKPDVAALARFNQPRVITIAWAKKWIGPEGGRLDFLDFAIDVPAGAVDQVTQFSIRLPVNPHGSDCVVAEFGPHGSTFAVPVTIELPFRGTSIEGSASAQVVWWNDAWIDMGGTLTADGTRLRTTTDHFSTYGTTDDTERGGNGLTVSGG
jgi:hypothetical protein